jgi:glycine oxidase
MNSEVLIIGGGVIGLSIARELHHRGVRGITIVDRGPVGGESSWAAAGMLAPNIETETSGEFNRFGIESLQLYPKLAEALLDETGIDIELDRSGTLCLAFDEAEAAELKRKYDRQSAAGVRVDHLSGQAVRRMEPSVSEAACAGLFYPDDWQVENRRLISALAKYAELNGIRVIENTEIAELLTEGTTLVGASTVDRDRLEAGVTVLATGAWTSLIKIGDAVLPIAVTPIRGQMISFQTGERLLHHVVYSTGGYLVPRADGRILVGATVEDAGFEKAVTQEGLASLVLAALEILPSLASAQVVDRWSGLRPFAADSLPILGELPGYENILVATAHYRNGILLAPKTAEIMAEKIISGRTSRFLESFGVRRVSDAAIAIVR